jgi:hypothetical protein
VSCIPPIDGSNINSNSLKRINEKLPSLALSRVSSENPSAAYSPKINTSKVLPKNSPEHKGN